MTKKDTILDGPAEAFAAIKDAIENCPILPYLEESKYHLAKEERVYKPSGALAEKRQFWVNENLGIGVDLAWPAKTAIVSVMNVGTITSPLEVLYSDVDVLKKILIDASGIRQSQGAAPGSAIKRNI